MIVSNETILFWSYLACGPITWALYGVGMYAGRRKLLLLEQTRDVELPRNPPKVTILIPAKDEGEPIRECLASALAQDYPNFEVLAINDRSTDNTGAIMDEMARTGVLSSAEHVTHSRPKLRVLHIPHNSVPPGWTGKNNALFTAIKNLPPLPPGEGRPALSTAEGGEGGTTNDSVSPQHDWFLFVDSDVTLQPSALTNCMRYALAKNYSFVTLLLKLRCQTFWEKLLMPLSAAGIVGLYTVALANNNRLKNVAFANGQFILCRRDAYFAFGTHEAVKSAFSEDVEIAKLAKTKGLKPRVAWGIGQAEVRMYSSLPKLIRGWGRNYFGCGRGSPWRIFAGIFFVIFSCYSVYAVLAFSIWRIAHRTDLLSTIAWPLAAVAHFTLMTLFLAKTYEWSGNPKRNALFFPLGGALMLWIFAVALKLCATKKVTWRGDSYSPATAPAA